MTDNKITLTFQQIISVDQSPAKVVLNVPDVLAPEIPPAVLVFPKETADITVLNKKTWTQDQVSVWVLLCMQILLLCNANMWTYTSVVRGDSLCSVL